MSSVDENTRVAIEIIMKGTKVTEDLILKLLEMLESKLQGEENKNDLFLDETTKEGKMQIKELLNKHKEKIVALDENLTKNQMKDYLNEFKKLGVDFSVTKNGKDSYSFFFAGGQANIVEKALKNIIELKNSVANNEEVLKAQSDLEIIQNTLSQDSVDKVKSLYDMQNDLAQLKENISNLSEGEKELFNAYTNVDTVKENKQKEIIAESEKVKEGEKEPTEKIEVKEGEKLKGPTVEMKKRMFQEFTKDLSPVEKNAYFILNKSVIEKFNNQETEKDDVLIYQTAYDKLKRNMPKESIDKIEKIFEENMHVGVTVVPEDKVYIYTVDKFRKQNNFKEDEMANFLRSSNYNYHKNNYKDLSLDDLKNELQKINTNPPKIDETLAIGSYRQDIDFVIQNEVLEDKIQTLSLYNDLKDNGKKLESLTKFELSILSNGIKEEFINVEDLPFTENDIQNAFSKADTLESSSKPTTKKNEKKNDVKKDKKINNYTIDNVRQKNDEIKKSEKENDKDKKRTPSMER